MREEKFVKMKKVSSFQKGILEKNLQINPAYFSSSEKHVLNDKLIIHIY